MTLWLIRAGSHGEHEQKFLDEGRVYVWGSPDSVDTDQGFTGVSVEVAMNLCSHSIGLM